MNESKPTVVNEMKQAVLHPSTGKPFRGIIPPLITPLTGPDELDTAGLERLVEHVLGGGVHGLFVLGTTGEGPSLGQGLRERLVRRVCAQVGGRVPVLVGIMDTAFADSLQLADVAAQANAAAVVVTPPFYFAPDQAELLEYLEHLTAALPLPLFLYNMPALCKVAFAPETVRRALDLPGVAGIKDSSGDMNYFREIAAVVAQRDSATLLMGPEELLPDAIRAGGHGGIPGGANLCPGLFVALYDALVAGDAARAAALQADVERLGRLYRVGQYGSAIVKGLKCALNLRSLCNDFMAEPFRRFRTPERERIARLLDDMHDLMERRIRPER
jgi:4-hydroxy-tetrahydrodipicolinate synthase